MKREVILALALIAGSSAGPGPALAHHGTAGYSMDKVVALNGTVSKFDWNNPHCIIYMAAKRENGDVEHWVLELGAPVHMTRVGWTKNSLRPGDQIVAETHPAKNGATVGTTGMQSSVLKVIVNGLALPTR